ncbi:phage portal protein [Microtetraspora fusca]|uniref:Phage portal protein n=1 Tax=Microtetraspora fusca TaxID=1997 RepID=A0ABW6VH30_MICFU
MEVRELVRRVLPGRSRLQRADEHKIVFAEYAAGLAAAGLSSTYRPRPWPVERAVAEAYERLVYVYKAVEAIAGNAARLPFVMKDGEDVVEDHPLYRILNKQANPIETGRQFRKRLAAQVLLSKRGAFVEVTRSRGGDVVRMDLLPPGRTFPVPGTGQDLISHYEVIRADGSRQPIPVENVRWFREPHPVDPFSGVTPLEAAGLSVELDFFSRLYNVAFLKNDARPGGVLAINGEMDPDDMDRIESKFGKGAAEAGKMTVIAGDVSYVDLATRPRDMAYETTSQTAKTEILTAFGVPESVIGYAAERTYSNADAELYAFWTITMPVMLDLLATGFDDDSSDDLLPGFDVSGVEVLQRAEKARREEARSEYDMGLITIDEYREVAGRDPIDMPRTRALWLPSGKTLVATSEADQKTLDEEAAAKVPPALQDNMAQPGDQPPGQEDAQGAGSPPDQPAEPDQPATPPQPPARKDHPARAGTARPVLRLVRPTETKQAGDRESQPDLQHRDKVEATLAAVLTATAVRLIERTASRLASPKARKGTRHWVAEYPVDTRVGTKALDAGTVVDAGRWQEEAEQAAHPVIQAAAAVAAAGLVEDLAPGVDVPLVLGPVVAGVVGMVGSAAAEQAERLRRLVVTADQAGASIDDIVQAVRDQKGALPGWADRLAVQAATAVIGGARDVAAQALAATGLVVDKEWRSRRDEQVRLTHRAADGQSQPVGEFFHVGTALLRYPGDPAGPPGEVYNCRCWAAHRCRVSGRFVAPPEGMVTRFTRADREAAAAA